MPVNRNALIRFKTIDKCLQNHYRKWTLEDLIDECSEALYEYEGIDKGISRRTIQMDIQMMRSDKLGYNAPIVVRDKKYYSYSEKEYSITNIPITDQDLGKLSEAVEFLKQFKGFSHFKELDGMIQKLEDHVYSQKTHQKPVIDFEKNDNLKGIEFLEVLYQHIIRKESINITYQSFKAREASTFLFYPYLLKEFRNRWFLVGSQKKNSAILTLALDRTIAIEKSEHTFYENNNFDADTFFKDAIGVSVSPGLEPQNVLLFVNHYHAPYVLTKPFHPSQKLVEKTAYGVIISLTVQHNFELEKEILGMGEGIKVIAPEKLKRTIKERLSSSIDLYNTEINESNLLNTSRKLEHKGYSILNCVYTQREINKMRALTDNYFKSNPSKHFAKRKVLQCIPELKNHLFNENFKKIIRSINENAFLSKSIYFDKPADANWYVTWHQDVPINVKKKKETKGYSGWTSKDGVIGVCPPEEISKNIFSMRIHLDDTTAENGALKIIPGSHNKRLSTEETQLITTNCIPTTCEVYAGGIQLMKPLLLHSSAKSTNAKKRRVIHLEFTSAELPKGLEWEEKEIII
ncbi:MAG: WYL domain-containing protein [Bacteroidetes bacterium]|nr:WYL domain-containing protein [Bacteroidota bacterium]